LWPRKPFRKNTDDDRLLVKHIVYDLVTVHNSDRVRLGDAVADKAQNTIAVVQKFGCACLDECRIVDSRDAVARYTTPQNLLCRDKGIAILKTVPAFLRMKIGAAKQRPDDEQPENAGLQITDRDDALFRSIRRK
jgi:hypothetical protein